MIRSRGHCNTMGTASTMGLLAEALGMTLPGTAGTPAPDSRLLEAAHETGRLAVELVDGGRRPSTVLTRGSFHNAIVALAAIGGSTNAVVHLLAIAGRLGIDADARRLRPHRRRRAAAGQPAAGRRLPDGGLPPRRRAARRPARGARPARSVRADGYRQAAGRLPRRRADLGPRGDPAAREPLQAEAGIAVLRGNLAPAGAIIKPAAASPELLQHRGPARRLRLDRGLPRPNRRPRPRGRRDSVLVLRGCGPRGYPGMPEVANLPLPTKLLEQGVRDMVRICDGRMSGTAYGTVVLHVAPEAAAGGPLAPRPNRRLDRARRRDPALDSMFPDDELASPERSRPLLAASPGRRVAGRGSTSSTCCRPTPAPTWTSCRIERIGGTARVPLRPGDLCVMETGRGEPSALRDGRW